MNNRVQSRLGVKSQSNGVATCQVRRRPALPLDNGSLLLWWACWLAGH
jgi:hypothetical protein